MSRPQKLEDAAVEAFLADHPGWSREGGANGASGDALVRSFAFERYGDGLGFAVSVGVEADKADHHPDLFIGFCKVRVRWSTHDAGGISKLDIAAALVTDAIAARTASTPAS